MSQYKIITHDALRKLLEEALGKTAWRSRAGSGTGSIFTLQFGPALSADETQGEFSLMVYCAWRIVEGNQLLLSWHDDSDDILALGLAALHGLMVTDTKLSQWGDLTFCFSDGRQLQIVNDFSPFKDFDESWSVIYNGQACYSVKPGNSIDYELLTAK